MRGWLCLRHSLPIAVVRCGRLAYVMIVYNKTYRLRHVLLFHTQCLNLYVYVRSDSDDDEIDDKELNNILIVTQTPPYMKKHPQGDRHPNPDYMPRAKMSAEIAKVINDGLCYYEEELWNEHEVILSQEFCPLFC